MNIPGYKILQKIGKGGMSVVYLAIQESLQRRVALKILSPTLAKEKAFCQQLVEEGKTIASLSYPNIVTVYDVGCHEGNYYLSMEYINGGCLRQRMDKAQLDENEAIGIFRTLTKTLAFAHHHRILHKDIKPRNILFKTNGDLILTDFGIARSIEEEDDHEKTGFTLGSPRYMSPEQIRGKGVDKRSDYYSLGIVFYEMLTTKVPYDAKTALEIARKQLSSPIPNLPEEKQRFQPIINRLLAKKTEDRFENTSEILKALHWLAGSPDRRKSDRISVKQMQNNPDQIEQTQQLPTEKIREFIAAEDLEVRNIPSDTQFDGRESENELDETIELITNDIPSFSNVDSATLSSNDPIDLKVNVNDRMPAVIVDEIKNKSSSLKWFFLPAVAVILAIYFLLVRFTPYLNQEEQIQSSPDIAAITENAPIAENEVNSPQPLDNSEVIVDDKTVNPSVAEEQQVIDRVSETNTVVEAVTSDVDTAMTTSGQPVKDTTFGMVGYTPEQKIPATEPAEPDLAVSEPSVPDDQSRSEPLPQIDGRSQAAQESSASGEPASIEYSVEEMMDNGVSPAGNGRLIISAELEARVRRYFSQVQRYPDGHVKIVINQQDLYEADSPVLDMAARNYLDKLGYVIRNYSGFSINVIDLSRQNGTLGARNLSWDRAKIVADYLIVQGISADRVHHRGNNQGRNKTEAGIELLLTPII